MELLEELTVLKNKLEKQTMEKNEQCNIIDIKYYRNITLKDVELTENPLYLIEKEEQGKIKKELLLGDTIIADIGKDNQINMRLGANVQKLDILIQLQNIKPTSLQELKQIKQAKEREKEKRQEGKKEEQKEKKQEVDNKQKKAETKQEKKHNPKDAEVDMDKKITKTKTFADLVPEVKEKQIEKVRVRRLDATRFEFYGEDSLGQEVAIESLRMVEGTNPNKEINKINADGSEVEKEQVYSMFQIVHGTNEQNGNEGFSVDLEEGTGIVEIGYYRRSRDNEYMSIPVNLKNTNQKRTEKDIQEFAQKERNPEVNDNIEKANRILEEQDYTSIENVDDDLNNDRPETQVEYEESLIKEAAKRCKISETGFREILEQERREGEPIEDSIERAEDEINEQVIGERRR